MSESEENFKLMKYRRIRDDILDVGVEVDAVVVDGTHDRETLRHLGFDKPVFTRSKYTYTELADRIAKKFSDVAVLTDFDAEGELANELISKLLMERKVDVCKSCRERVRALLESENLTTIEGIYRLLL